MPRTLLAVALCLALAHNASAQTQEPASSGTLAPAQPGTRSERFSAETKGALLGFGIGRADLWRRRCADWKGDGSKSDSANSRTHVRRVAVSPAVSKSAVGAGVALRF